MTKKPSSHAGTANSNFLKNWFRSYKNSSTIVSLGIVTITAAAILIPNDVAVADTHTARSPGTTLSKVEGAVLLINKKPASGASITIHEYNKGYFREISRTRADKNGKFSMTLSPSVNDVEIHVDGTIHSKNLFHVQKVKLRPGETINMNVTCRHGVGMPLLPIFKY